MTESKWITPFAKQCFVTAGVSLNMAAFGATTGYPTALLPQLQAPGSSVKVDDSSGSWIVSIVGLAVIPTNLIAPLLMEKLGKKLSNIISLVPIIIGWLVIAAAESVAMIIIGRIIQGLALGISFTLGSALIGEYSSPKNRGLLLSTVSLAMGGGVFGIHAIGLYLHWQSSAFVCALLSFGNLIIVLYSPESPSWLIDQGRYDEGEKVFRWLRGDSEEDELMKMIEAHKELKKCTVEQNSNFRKRLSVTLQYCIDTVGKKEFYKPLVIVVHLMTITQWSGVNILASYAVTAVETIVGTDSHTSFIILSLGLQRLISSTTFVYVIKKVKRRTMLIASCSTNISALMLTAGYTYLKLHNFLPYDHHAIGIFLIHLHVFSLASGTQVLVYVVAGELFPLEYRSFSSAVTCLAFIPNFVVNVKTFPYLFKEIGLHGCYILNAAAMLYCTVVIYSLMPETKDRTLLDIEDEFRGRKRTAEDMKVVQTLTSSAK